MASRRRSDVQAKWWKTQVGTAPIRRLRRRWALWTKCQLVDRSWAALSLVVASATRLFQLVFCSLRLFYFIYSTHNYLQKGREQMLLSSSSWSLFSSFCWQKKVWEQRTGNTKKQARDDRDQTRRYLHLRLFQIKQHNPIYNLSQIPVGAKACERFCLILHQHHHL